MASYYKRRESYEWRFLTYRWKEKLSSALRFSGGEDIWCFIHDLSSLFILKGYSSSRAITGHVQSDQWTSKEKCARVGGTVMFRQAASFDCLVVTFCFSSFKMVFSQNFLFRFFKKSDFCCPGSIELWLGNSCFSEIILARCWSISIFYSLSVASCVHSLIIVLTWSRTVRHDLDN